MPIKIVDDELQSFKKKVVKGNSIVFAVVAMIEDKSSLSKRPKDKFKVLRVLLDNGSDGDLLFLPKGKHPVVLLKKRIAPQIGELLMARSKLWT